MSSPVMAEARWDPPPALRARARFAVAVARLMTLLPPEGIRRGLSLLMTRRGAPDRAARCPGWGG